MTDASTTIRLRDTELSWRTVDDEIVVLDERTWNYFTVNGTGATLWPVITDGATVDELTSVLLDAYEVDAASARTDVEAFVAGLREQGLLQA